MSEFVFNIAIGKVATYVELPAANDALIAVPIEASGLEADATLRTYSTLSALLAASNNEQTTLGRKTLASVTSGSGNPRYYDAADLSWLGGTGNAIAAIVVCYDPDTTGGTDADLVPLVKLYAPFTPTGGDISYIFNTNGFASSIN